jgi:hypothetical protein
MAAPSGGYTTGAPEKYVGKEGGSADPCSQCAHSSRPAHRYRASSVNAVFDQMSLSDSTAWTRSTTPRGHPPRSRACPRSLRFLLSLAAASLGPGTSPIASAALPSAARSSSPSTPN